MRLLLDTCTFLWLATDDAQLSARCRELFVDPTNELYLSPVSAWEIAVKNSLGRLPLPAPPSTYIPDARHRNGILTLPLSEEAMLQITKLPSHHRDPFDRMLICQALIEGLVILTPDSLISQYPVRVAW
jgi:PIN domain nuclease of toxin-antitoxin system